MEQTITIDEKQYKVNSITDNGKLIINSIQKIDNKISELEFQIQTNQYARTYLAQELKQELANFEEVEKEENVESD